MLIKEIPLEERPRERLLKYGASNLSNEELLSIVLRCGTKNVSVKELSSNILKEYKTLSNIKNATINKLSLINGMGLSKSMVIVAMLELSKRIYVDDDSNLKICFNNPKKIYEYTKYMFRDKEQELFYCLYFNNKQHLVGKELLFIGTVNKSLTHPREIFKYAYLYSASSIVCLHNHPSGDVTPSREDISFTSALVEIGNIQKIPIIDHIIVSNNNYYSFQDNGKINNR
ncbi:MAG: DNA repair protein RadC [Bacilli bacterium]|nr:DNA repair protein RadC [Bacilli bacterium]